MTRLFPFFSCSLVLFSCKNFGFDSDSRQASTPLELRTARRNTLLIGIPRSGCEAVPGLQITVKPMGAPPTDVLMGSTKPTATDFEYAELQVGTDEAKRLYDNSKKLFKVTENGDTAPCDLTKVLLFKSDWGSGTDVVPDPVTPKPSSNPTVVPPNPTKTAEPQTGGTSKQGEGVVQINREGTYFKLVLGDGSSLPTEQRCVLSKDSTFKVKVLGLEDKDRHLKVTLVTAASATDKSPACGAGQTGYLYFSDTWGTAAELNSSSSTFKAQAVEASALTAAQKCVFAGTAKFKIKGIEASAIGTHIKVELLADLPKVAGETSAFCAAGSEGYFYLKHFFAAAN